jgi:hypothetical protein
MFLCVKIKSFNMYIISLLQKVDVSEKIKNAPDSGYQIGVVIGSFIPFVILIGIAYWMYNRAKKRDENGY